MNGEGALARRPRHHRLTHRSEVSTASGGGQTVEALVERCRDVAAATGFSWVHDLVVEQLERLCEQRAA